MKKHKSHVLGMAKSHTNLNKAGQRKSLELDFFRLAYCVMRLRQRGESAIGYLCVMTSRIAKSTRSWIDKYGTGDTVTVIVASPSTEQMLRLAAEKEDNVQGMVDGTIGKSVDGRSDASCGKSLGEEALRDFIQQRYSGVQEVTDKSLFPCGIQWDFYGVSEGRVSVIGSEN